MDSLAAFDHSALINDYLIPWGIRIALALAIYVLGRILARWVVRLSERLMNRSGMDAILVKFLSNVLNALLLAVILIAALDELGVQTTSLLALLGAAGLAVGLALKDSLSNFSAGVMLIIFRPFKQGDFIEAAGVSGVVETVGIFNTTLRTGDNREIIVPNSQIYGGTITNVSARPTRRIDLLIGIGYEDDIRKAKGLLEEIMAADARILEDPAPTVVVADLADSSVNLGIRPWVNSGDYWAVRCDLLETIKLRFDESGISIPYPQTDVHLYQA
ncbi:mechanosensitive ion channel [Thiohalobacter sp. IOR34]|uniref:mechanosensitive ion channel family protein n=1 Tax=Thiohalobacter sp. IOR34 TaxID=3057176 RepID=UPI0025B0E505|nr:mechanosensitive ion channel domain-containing protein [Thiohalobacter sp. IOR34]WJW76681.1 mechanosensitive ion channel [Thiohalobacter sp. IOR34]